MDNKIINKYIINKNEDGYVNGFYSVTEGNYDFEGQMADYPEVCDGWYKFQNGAFVEDATKKAEIIAERQKQERISELKAYLDSTDYIYNSIREGGRTEEYYAEVIEQRKAARKEIQELEGD